MVTRVHIILCYSALLITSIGVKGAPQAAQNVKDYDDDGPEDPANSTHSRLGRQGKPPLLPNFER